MHRMLIHIYLWLGCSERCLVVTWVDMEHMSSIERSNYNNQM